MKKIWREIEIMKKIDHKNIIKLYQVLQTDDYLFLITDYCEGGELFDYLIQHGKRTTEERLRTLCSLLANSLNALSLRTLSQDDSKRTRPDFCSNR